MAETEAPATRRKPPVTPTSSIYSHRARRRLYLTPEGAPGGTPPMLRGKGLAPMGGCLGPRQPALASGGRNGPLLPGRQTSEADIHAQTVPSSPGVGEPQVVDRAILGIVGVIA